MRYSDYMMNSDAAAVALQVSCFARKISTRAVRTDLTENSKNSFKWKNNRKRFVAIPRILQPLLIHLCDRTRHWVGLQHVMKQIEMASLALVFLEKGSVGSPSGCRQRVAITMVVKQWMLWQEVIISEVQVLIHARSDRLWTYFHWLPTSSFSLLVGKWWTARSDVGLLLGNPSLASSFCQPQTSYSLSLSLQWYCITCI